MSTEQITLTARFVAAPGKADELRAELLALVPQTRSEPGNIDYHCHEDPASPGTFLFYENFVNQAALDEHAAKPYIQQLLAKVDTLCAEPPVLTPWKMLSERPE